MRNYLYPLQGQLYYWYNLHHSRRLNLPPTDHWKSLGCPIKKSPWIDLSNSRASTKRIDIFCEAWGKCWRILCAATTYGSVHLFSNIYLFLAIQIPHVNIHGRALNLAVPRSDIQSLSANSMLPPFHRVPIFSILYVASQDFFEYSHSIKRWYIDSPACLHIMHHPGPANALFCSISLVGALLVMTAQYKILHLCG